MAARLGEVVPARPGDEHAREERRQEVGDDVAVLVFERTTSRRGIGRLVDLLEPFDQVEDELQVRGVGRAENDGVETGDRDGGDGAARRERIFGRVWSGTTGPGCLGGGIGGW